MRRQALLSGEHPTLPAAELRALLDVHEPGARLEVEGSVASIEGGPGADDALRRAVLMHEWGEPWAEAPDTAAGLEALVEAVSARADGRGSAAVATERRGRDKSGHSMAVAAALGAALKAAGHPIDLRQPDRTVYAWLLDGQVVVGERLGQAGRAAFEERVTDLRPHFSPVSLHPRRAASLLHLARVAPGGTVYDPFCGTGGFLLEAALEGYRVLASDLDPFMVQGTLQTLTDVPAQPLDADAFVADIGDAPALAGPVDGVVTDLPYGRASGTDKEAVDRLYARAFEAFRDLLRPGGHAVVGHAQPRWVPDVPCAGLKVIERHSEYSHKSLTRHFAVVKRVEGVEGA